ncbi:MAG: hypothetical protein PHE55_23005, partial [Methylococcaceae bacterium]|nr:hypothetical protein [Methylococcaceae bacterium]
MANSPTIPRSETDKLALLRHLNASLPGSLADALSIPADRLARLGQATASLDFALAYQTALKNAAEGASALKKEVLNGPVMGSLSLPPLTLPIPPGGPLFE